MFALQRGRDTGISRSTHSTRHGAVVADQRGVMTVFVLGLCVAVMFVGGMSVDFWRLIAARRALATAADAAATAGANGLRESELRAGRVVLDPARARALAADNLSTAQGDARRAVATIDADTVEVRVVLVERVDVSLLGILGGHEAFTVRVSATASPRRVP